MMKFLLAAVLLFTLTLSQVHQDIEPLSKRVGLSKSVPTISLEHVDHKQCEEEDQIEKSQAKEIPMRFGKPISVKYTLENSGIWEQLKDNSRVWRLKISTVGAFHTNLIFKKFLIPFGATLHVIGKDNFIGAFTSENNKEDGVLATGPLLGDFFTLEYFEPKNVLGLGEIELETVVHAYKDIFEKNGRSGSCNFNAVCPIGDKWRDPIRSVAALMTASGSRFCSGSMINNNAKDGKQLFLTAAHCGTPSSAWVALFNYQSITCPRGGQRLLNYTASGMRVLANHRVSDFSLAEIIEKIPTNYNVYLSGYSALDTFANASIGIHHPAGDVKKISFSYARVTNGSWTGGPPNTHWRVQPWNNGTTEPGSSGSPLFNPAQQIIGQLHGGSASCGNMAGFDVYGKLFRSWDVGTTAASRLKDHLDPKNTGVKQIQGINLNDARKPSVSSVCANCLSSCQFFTQAKNTRCVESCSRIC